MIESLPPTSECDGDSYPGLSVLEVTVIPHTQNIGCPLPEVRDAALESCLA